MANIQDMLGSYPFAPDKKVPMRLRKREALNFIYPPHSPEKSDMNWLYASTDKLLVGIYRLAPGGSFDPPDIHPGDEAYYILRGTVVQHNPVSGQFIEASAGDGIWLPREAWHKAYNFGDEVTDILFFIAPKPWDEHIPPPDFPTSETMKMYKGPQNGSKPDVSPLPAIAQQPSTDDLGRWPMVGKEGRKPPYPIFAIKNDDKLINIHGWKNPMLMKFFVSNDLLHMGEMILPAGGLGPRLSDPDVHAGDCVLYVEKGPIDVNFPDTEEVLEIEPEDCIYIPAGTKYQLMNFTAAAVKAIFCIAPAL